MKLTGKVSAGMANWAKSMKDGVDNCKLDGKIAEQEKLIKELTKEIGNLAVMSLEAGAEMGPEIMERYTAIREAKEAILVLENERKRKTIVCPSCGAKTAVGMKFCGNCGVNLEEV